MDFKKLYEEDNLLFKKVVGWVVIKREIGDGRKMIYATPLCPGLGSIDDEIIDSREEVIGVIASSNDYEVSGTDSEDGSLWMKLGYHYGNAWNPNWKEVYADKIARNELIARQKERQSK